MTSPETTRPDAVPQVTPGPARCALWWRWAELMLAVALACAVFLMFTNSTRHIDEYYHVLAAESLLADGDLRIGEVGEPYTRAKGYTYAVAASFRLFGEGRWQSRVPSLLAGLLLVGGMFGWSRWRFDRLTAWVALGLMLQMPLMVYASEFCRFYMVQAAAVVWLLIAMDLLLAPGVARRWRIVAALIGGLSAAVAWHVQVSSVFGIGLVMMGVVLALAWRLLGRWPSTERGRPYWLAGMLAGVGLLALAGVQWLGPVREQWLEYRAATIWAAQTRDDARYYLDYFYLWHRWPLFMTMPAVALAWYRWRWHALWVVAIFAGGLAAHSFAGMKAPRYLLWAFPYFALTLAMGVSALVWVLTRRPGRPGSFAPWPMRLCVTGLVLVLLAYALSRTLGPYQVRTMLTGNHHAYVFADWEGVRPILASDSAWEGGVLLASADVKAIGALGRCDYSLSRTRSEGRAAFEIDWRTGRPVVYTPGAIAQIVREHPAGLVVIELSHWRQSWAVPDEVADWLESDLERLAVSPRMQLVVFRWDRREHASTGTPSE